MRETEAIPERDSRITDHASLAGDPLHDALPPAVLGVVLGLGPAGVEAVFDLEAVEVTPAALLGQVVANDVFIESGECPCNSADIPGTVRGQG